MRERLNDFLHIDRKPGCSFYVKTGCEEFFIRRPAREYEGYQVLRQHLRMPRAKLIHTASQGPMLVVEAINSPASNHYLRTHPELVKTTVQAFLADLQKMWLKTAQPYDRNLISRDWQNETISTLEKLYSCRQLEDVLDKELVVNGVRYPSLGDTLTRCFDHLTSAQESVMVLCHGDEHLGNLLPADNGYWAIDPGNFNGYNTVSSVINNMVGGTYLFEYEYEGEASQHRNQVQVEYQVQDCFREAETTLKPLFRSLDNLTSEHFGPASTAKELLFVNELRVAVGWVKRNQDITQILKNGMMYAGLATEHYYADQIV